MRKLILLILFSVLFLRNNSFAQINSVSPETDSKSEKLKFEKAIYLAASIDVSGYWYFKYAAMHAETGIEFSRNIHAFGSGISIYSRVMDWDDKYNFPFIGIPLYYKIGKRVKLRVGLTPEFFIDYNLAEFYYGYPTAVVNKFNMAYLIGISFENNTSNRLCFAPEIIYSNQIISAIEGETRDNNPLGLEHFKNLGISLKVSYKLK